MDKTRGTRFVNVEDAVKTVRSHDNVILANFCAEPRFLPDMLMDRAEELQSVRIYHLTPFGPFQDKYLIPGMDKHIRCATSFCGRRTALRQLVKEGRADFYPLTFGNIPNLFRKGDFKCDVLMLTVTPPDSEGYCSLGVSVDYIWGALERGPRVVMAEINRHMPRTHGMTSIHMSQIDYAVEVDTPIFELEQYPISEVEEKIGAYVASLVEDGSTLQIGYGGVSEAATYFLKDKMDLGVHSEMIPEGLREIAMNGCVTNAKKGIHQGKIVCTFHGGTKKLYEWLHENPMIEMQPVDYTNDPKVIARNRKMVAINAALQVDLFGNIYSDIFGLDDQYTGSGGQLDFAIGCAVAKDAKFINAIPSTTHNGKYSRIVVHPSLDTDNTHIPIIPTVPRYYADYVVTEFGIARLKGKSNQERARELINIAHPDFRGTLEEDAKKIGLL